METKFNQDKAVFFSGPRPKNLFQSYDPMHTANKRMLLKLREVIIDHIENKGIDTFISGMALGIDLWAARIVIKLREEKKYSHIKLVGAIPCLNQSDKWPKNSQDEWLKVFEACNETHYVTNKKYSHDCMQLRNEWMVDHASRGISVFTGASGGTMNCLLYAKKQGLGELVTIISPHSLVVQEGI
jgi:uncharacterized phage-like protein YoqJ